MLFHPYGNKCLFRQCLTFIVAQQIAAQYRSECQSHHRRSKQRHNKGNAQRNQHTPFHSCQEKQRNKADYNNQGRVQDRHTHFLRSIEHDFNHALTFPFGQQAILTQVLPYIFHIHNGIIHQRTNGNGHTTQTHGIDGESHIVKSQYRNNQ